MADTVKQALARRGLLNQIVLPPLVDGLLDAMTTPGTVPDGPDVAGEGLSFAERRSLGSLALDLTPPAHPLAYRLVSDASSFRFWLVLNSGAPERKVFDFAKGAVGVALKAAQRATKGDEEFLVPAPGEVAIKGLDVALLVEGRAGEPARVSLSPTVGQPRGMVALSLDPPTVLVGDSGFVLEFGTPGSFVIHDADDAAAPGETVLDGTRVPMRADDPAWRGMVARKLRFYLPRGVPWLGGHAVDACFEIGMGAGEGIDLAVATRVPPKDTRPGIAVRIECRDPAATGLQDFLPTLVEASMELPLDGKELSVPDAGGGFKTLAGKPVVARARFARSSADPVTRLTLGIESQGAPRSPRMAACAIARTVSAGASSSGC